MSFYNQTTIFGSNINAVFSKGYEKGRKEQLEHDLSMIQDVLLKSDSYDDFKDILGKELKKLDLKAANMP